MSRQHTDTHFYDEIGAGASEVLTSSTPLEYEACSKPYGRAKIARTAVA
jgi:hypothetical protein